MLLSKFSKHFLWTWCNQILNHKFFLRDMNISWNIVYIYTGNIWYHYESCVFCRPIDFLNIIMSLCFNDIVFVLLWIQQLHIILYSPLMTDKNLLIQGFFDEQWRIINTEMTEVFCKAVVKNYCCMFLIRPDLHMQCNEFKMNLSSPI